MFVEINKGNLEELWRASELMELSALSVLTEQLQAFEPAIRKLYAAGVQAPTLPGKRVKELDLMLAALFLKKALNDLRSAWLLLRVGYTSQAAAVVASLYENALSVSCLAGQEENAKRLQKDKSGDLPWTPTQLAKNLAGLWREYYLEKGKKFDNDDYELSWREIYAGYKWLCKIKHPTMGSAIHDASSTTADSEEFVVMAAPDTRPENLAVKATILGIAISRIREAIRSFVLAMDVDDTSAVYRDFVESMDQVLEMTKEAYVQTATEQLPFGLPDSSLTQAYKRLKKKKR